MFDLTGMKAIIGPQLKMLHLPGAAATIVYTRPDSFFGDQVFFFCPGGNLWELKGTRRNSHPLET